MKEHDSPSTIRLQVYDRMRAPVEARPFILRFHVIQAIRRSTDIADAELIYQRAMRDIKYGNNARLIDSFGTFMKQLVAGELKGHEIGAASQVLREAISPDTNTEIIDLLKAVDSENLERDVMGFVAQRIWELLRQTGAYENSINFEKFNSVFLNSNGADALLMSILINAADLDLAAIDKFRGGQLLEAAYGRRRTQAAKREGPRIQALLKQLASFDEPSMIAAADQYVVYRYLHGGRFSDYERRELRAGHLFSTHHARDGSVISTRHWATSPQTWPAS